MTSKVKITFEFYDNTRQISLVGPRDGLTNSEWTEAIRKGLDRSEVYSVISRDLKNSIIQFPSKSVFILTVQDENAEDTTTI